MRRFLKAVPALLLSLAFSLEACVPARGQLISIGKRRRVGRVVLPTPPFNPDAGILDGPRGRARNTTKAAPRRTPHRHRHAHASRLRLRAPKRPRLRHSP
jgi:hypothetical protein